ncbi:hypothetical protein BpHYR1_004898 [Brachionus plicatilis]|uniref:Uncharacterized protein n=1 Tax=Brachionus plicatilis TaxID=10195 RepID=A0A3M7RR95_BRAPC|nr:hypothetical protein BpHYR1_004898 [Brachionus plicatilis]
MLRIFALMFWLGRVLGQNVDIENGCYLQFESQELRTRDADTLDAYAGNGFTYDIACTVTDSTMRSGDKYYVIDLVLYGPNSRVSKAWREQFSTHRKYRSLSLNKKISLNSIGTNTLVCSVSKYNNLVNKFTKICNKKMDINATESGLTPTVQYQSTKFNFVRLSDLQRLSLRKKVFRVGPSKENGTEADHVQNGTSILGARAMFYKSLFESKIEDKRVTASNGPMAQSEPSHGSSFSFLQPIFVIFIFLVIFSISIGTIVYLTYNQNEYASVMGDHESDLTSCQSHSRDETINNSVTISH